MLLPVNSRQGVLFKRGCHYTPECDIYSLGMTLWELASRKLPFVDANDNGEISVWVLQGEQETIPTDIPEGIKSVIQVCWSSQAALRPSAAKLVELLTASTPATPPQQPSASPTPDYHFRSNRGREHAAPSGGPPPQASGGQDGYQFHSAAGRSRGVRGRPGFFSPPGRADDQMNSGTPTTLADQKNGEPSHTKVKMWILAKNSKG
jgi:serine/threonine protein kinase